MKFNEPGYAFESMPKSGRLAKGGVALVAVTCALHVHCSPASDVSTAPYPAAERMMSDARPAHADDADRGRFVFDTHRQTMTASVDGALVTEIDSRGSHVRIERMGISPRNTRLRGNVLRASGDAERFVFARGEELEELALLSRPMALAYRFALPERFHLRSLSSTIAQIDDASGEPWLRMRADRAWSEDGRVISVSLAVDGDVVRVVVPSDAPYPLLVDPIWAAATSPTGARVDGTATVLGDGRVLITGGFDFALSDTAEIYDPRTGIFTAVPGKMMTRRSRHSAIMLPSGKVMLVGGTNQPGTNAEIFDPKTATFATVTAGTNLTAGQAFATRLLDGKVLIKGKIKASVPPDTVGAEIFDPTSGTYSSTTAGALDARGKMITLNDGRVLLIGESSSEVYDPQTTNWTATSNDQLGSSPESRSATLLRDGRVATSALYPCTQSAGLCAAFQLFDPTTGNGTWGPLTSDSPPEGRGTSLVELPSGKVLVAGSISATTVARLYDPATNTVAVDDGAMLSAHHGQSATVLPGGDVLIVGGDQNTADIRSFKGDISPTTGTMVSPRYAAMTQRLRDGTVLIAGGSFHPPASAATTYATAELYDPVAKTFSATNGPMTTPREHAVIAMLPSGKVLIAGGNDASSDVPKSSAEVYDPTTKQFTAVGSMTVARTYANAATLPGGKILVAGGCSDVSTCFEFTGANPDFSRLKSAELYDPVSQTFSATIGAMIAARSEHGMVTMPDGDVIVLGTVGGFQQIAEAYRTKTGNFVGVGNITHRHDGRSAQLVSSGKVFLGGGGGQLNSVPNELYDPATKTFSLLPSVNLGLLTAHYVQPPGGHQMLLVGGVFAKGNGYDTSDTASSQIVLAELLAPQNSTTVIADPGASAARSGPSTASVDHGVLVAGGDTRFALNSLDGTVTDTAYVHSDGLGDSDRPVLSGVPAKITAGTTTTITGQRFTTPEGDTPLAFWQPAGTNTVLPSVITDFTATSATWRAPVTALYGNGWLHVVTRGVVSNSMAVEIEAAAQGTTCKYDADCTSGFCTEGVCCDSRCDATCQSCTARRKGSGSDGTCAMLVPGQDPDKKCVRGVGGACTTKAECASGFCVEGFCCDRACNGNCESCKVTPGICKVVEPCGDAGQAEPQIACDGDHTLMKGSQFIADCKPYKCNGDACRVECASADDCLAPLICSYEGKCVDVPIVRPAQESLFGCASTGRPSGSFAALGVLLALAVARVARRRGAKC